MTDTMHATMADHAQVDRRPAAIPASLDMLDSAMAQLEKVTAQLTEHLAPVLEGPVPRPGDGEMAGMATDSDVAQRVVIYARRVAQVVDQLADVESRLAL